MIAARARRRPVKRRHKLVRHVPWLGADSFAGQWIIAGLTLFAVLFNALLAMANALVAPMSTAIVTVCEIGILGAGMLVILTSGFRREDRWPMALLYLFLLLAAGMSLVNGFPFPDAIRNVAILCVFTMLGLRASESTLRTVFVAMSALVLAVLLLEIVSTTTYVRLFEPASYYQNTRGSEIKEWDDSGLFQNARAFAGRFSFGLIDHRAASLFLEQVSLANFAGIMSIYLVTMWQRLTWWERLGHLGVVTLALVANSTRTSTVIAMASIGGYFIYPLLPRYLNAFIAPAILVGGFLLIGYTGMVEEDTLIGRVSITVGILREMDLSVLFGMEAARARTWLDSGYAYVIGSASVVGAIALCCYFCFIVPQVDKTTRRLAWALSVYVFFNMMIGGTAIFSIKIAAPLWLLVGHIIASLGKRENTA